MTVWDVVGKLLSRLFDAQDSQFLRILSKLEQIMTNTNEIITGVAEANASVTEAKSDLVALLALHTKDAEAIVALEASVADLKAQVGELAQLDAIKAAVDQLKANAAEAAAVFTPAPAAPVV